MINRIRVLNAVNTLWISYPPIKCKLQEAHNVKAVCEQDKVNYAVSEKENGVRVRQC